MILYSEVLRYFINIFEQKKKIKTCHNWPVFTLDITIIPILSISKIKTASTRWKNPILPRQIPALRRMARIMRAFPLNFYNTVCVCLTDGEYLCLWPVSSITRSCQRPQKTLSPVGSENPEILSPILLRWNWRYQLYLSICWLHNQTCLIPQCLWMALNLQYHLPL